MIVVVSNCNVPDVVQVVAVYNVAVPVDCEPGTVRDGHDMRWW